MDTRPREERDLSEFYTSLDESARLPVFVVEGRENSPADEESSNTTRTPNASRGYIESSLLRENERQTGRPHPKFNKLLLPYGYKSSSAPKRSSEFYVRNHQAALTNMFVAYDMDEQDRLYLEWLNSNTRNMKISLEEFEVAMSVLEYEWHKLGLLMAASAGHGQDNRDDLKLDASYEKYGSDDGTGGVDSISEQRCAVCNDSECDNTNAIVFCDGCNIAVHQECYGVAFIPEGQWFCRRCMVSRGSSVTCTFCPSGTGAFKQLDNGVWSHVVCALWINELYFANPIYLEPIEGVDSIPRNRWKLVCYICKQKTGACIQCSNRSCFSAYHVTCAKRAGLYMAMEKGLQGALASKSTLKSFCDKHLPAGHDREVVLSGITKTRMYFRDSFLISQKNDRLASKRRQANRVNTFKWKTENGTPIAPELFVRTVEAKLRALHSGHGGADRLLRGISRAKNLDQESNLKNTSAALCRYWCLKREAKAGAPLVRISAPTQDLTTNFASYPNAHDASSPNSALQREGQLVTNEIEEKVKFGKILENDLAQLIEMTKLTTKRQKLSLERDAELFKIAEVVYFPLCYTAIRLISTMCGILRSHKHPREDAKAYMHALEALLKGLSRKLYTTVSAIDHDVQRVFEGLMTKSMPQSATRALNFWNSVGLKELQNVEVNMYSDIPFTHVDGLESSLKPHDSKSLLDSEDLSEIEEDPFAIATNRDLFKKFLAC